MRSILEKNKRIYFQTIILANEAGGHGELGEDGQEGLVRKLLQLGDQTRAEEGPRGGTPGGLKHMAVVDTGSFQQFEVVRIIFRTYSYPELSEILERFLILFGKANFSFTYVLHAERRYLVYELEFRNNFKNIVINVLQK